MSRNHSIISHRSFKHLSKSAFSLKTFLNKVSPRSKSFASKATAVPFAIVI